jgi:hypothetical protein
MPHYPRLISMLRVAPHRVTAGEELKLMPTEAHMLRACDFVTCVEENRRLDDRNYQRASRLTECPVLRPAPDGDSNLWRRLVLPTRIETWSLTSLQQRLVKTGGRLVRHARYYWSCWRRAI